MAESVKDLVVRLSFEHGDTKSQIAAIKNETKLLDSGFQAAAVSAGGFSGKINEAAARADLLQKKIALQETAVQKYGQALQQARQRLQEAQNRHTDYGNKLDAARKKQTELTAQIDKLKTAMAASKQATGENTDEYIDMMIQLEDLQSELKATNNEIEQWESSLKRSDTAIANADKSIQQLTIAQNQAKTALGNMRKELDGTNPKIAAQKAALDAASKSLQGYASRAKAAGEAQESIGRTLSKGTAAVAAAGVASAGAAISWESSFADVKKTVSGTEKQLEELEQQLLEMSTIKPIENNTLAGIAANAGQLGVSTGYVKEFTGVIADLTNTTDLSAESAAKDFAQFKNITQMQEEHYSNMGSAVVALGNNTATTESAIVGMATNLASAGHQIGLTESQILGIGAALSSLGLESQAGGTAFSRLFVDMKVAAETGSDSLKDFANVAGMSAGQFKTAFQQDAAGAITAFINGLASGSKSAIVMLDEMGITETRFRDALLRTTNATELFAGCIDLANTAWEENTALANEANVRYSTTASRLTMVGNKAKNAAIAFGNDLLPVIHEGIDWLDELVDKFNALDEEQRKQVMTWAAYAAAVGPGILLLGKANKGIGTLASGMSKLLGAASAAGGGLNGVGAAIKTLLGPAGVVALVVGVAAGTIAFADWASGAKAAREATEDLMNTAKAWKETQASTIYDSGSADPLARFGLDADDFNSLASDSQDWIDELKRVWTDGAKESNEIVSQFTDAFAVGSDSVREKIKSRGSLLEGLGTLDDETRSKMDKDLATLESYDKEVAALLKKRQNGYLTDKETARLDEVIQLRAQLQLEYGGEDLDGYGQILQGMQAEIDRMTARGMGENADPTLYADTLNALADGRQAYNDALDASYNAQHAQIMAIQDEAQRTEALAALNAQYNQQRLDGEQAYRNAAAQAAAQAWEAGGYTEQIAQIDQLAAMLGDLENLDPVSMAQFTEGLDEGKLASMISMVEQLKDSGVGNAQLESMGIYYDDLMSKLTQIRDTASQIEGMEGIAGMFGEALPEEVQRIMIGLDMTQAAADWAAFMEGKNPFEAAGKLILNEVDETAIENWKAANADTPVQGPPVKLGVGLGDNWASDLRAAFDAGLLAVYGADGASLPVTPEVWETLDAGDVLMLGEDGTLHVIVTPDVEPTANAKVDIHLNPLDQAAISAWESASGGIELNGPTAKVGITLGADWKADVQAALDKGMLEISDSKGNKLPLTPEVLEKITANDVAAYEADGTLHILLTPKVGSTEAVEMTTEAMNSTPLDDTVFSFLGSSAQEDIDRINGIAAAAADLQTQIAALKASGNVFTENGLGLNDLERMETSALSDLAAHLRGLSEMDLQAIADQAANLMTALDSGELDPATAEQYRAQLQSILDLVGAADQYLGTGNDVSAGIAAGMQQYAWSGDAATLAESIRTAINGSLGVNSPATTMYPTGHDTAAGIAEGMKTYSFAATAALVSASIVNGFSGLNAKGYSIGANFGAGLQRGLSSKMASSLALARSYANRITAAFQSAWKIHSPSQVGEWLTNMFGTGMEKGMDKWPTVSERLLQQDIGLVHGVYERTVSNIDKSRTYNQSATVNVSVGSMDAHNAQDVQDLGYAIAGEVRKVQRGYGKR